MTHARNQDGFALVEVIVSAAVLAIVALAVLAGIDGATASTARERARAVAASLAEQDQERLRSFRFDELTKLVGLDPTVPANAEKINRSILVDGVTYTVQTKVDFQVDSGTPTTGCGTAGTGKQNEYLRIITTVTSSIVGTRVAPVKIESLVAPPVSGSLVVKVLNAKDAPVANADVIAKAKSGRVYSGQTDDQGCVPFVGVESGAYTVEATKPGHVDKTGKSPAEKETTVSPNLVNVETLYLDLAVDLTVNVRTLRPGTAWTSSATSYPSTTANVSDNSADPNTLRTYTPPEPASTITAPDVFPFASGYSFFTGKCAIQSPVKAGLTNYFSETNPAAVVIAEAGKAPALLTATVYQPALNLRLDSNSDLSSTYTVTAHLQGCADTHELAIKSWPSTGWEPNPSTSRNWIVQQGTDFDPGLPFGLYTLCVSNGSGRWWKQEYDNKATHRASTVTLPTSGYLRYRPDGC